MAKKRKWVLIAIVAGAILCCVGVLLVYLSIPRSLYSGELLANAEVFNVANQLQHHTEMRLTASGNKLYFHVSKFEARDKSYADWVCTIENGRINRITPIEGEVEFCMDTAACYQHGGWGSWNKDTFEYYVQLYDIPTKTEQKIEIIEERSDSGWYEVLPKIRFISPDSFLLANYSKDSPHMLYENGSYRDVEAKSVGYEIQGKTYCLEYSQEKDEVEIVSYDRADNREVLTVFPEWSSAIDLIPCDYGLLLHNYEDSYKGPDGVLYLVDKETGEIRELFNIPGMSSESSVNVWGKYVFISLKRWEGWSDTGKGMKRFENDQLEGTWRIDLTDGSKVKISDTIYTGLYIFDDSGIFACNKPMWNTNLYKLDFDGNVLFQILD